MTEDDRATVREGYDRLGEAYLSNRPADGKDVAFLDHFTERLDDGARVLDVRKSPCDFRSPSEPTAF